MPPLVRGPSPIDRGTAWAKFTRNCGIWALLGNGISVVIDQSDGSCLGDTDLARFGGSIDAMNEAAGGAWAMLEKARGQGIAFEAPPPRTPGDFECFGPQRTICTFDPDNTRSLWLTKTPGYLPLGNAIHEGGQGTLLKRMP